LSLFQVKGGGEARRIEEGKEGMRGRGGRRGRRDAREGERRGERTIDGTKGIFHLHGRLLTRRGVTTMVMLTMVKGANQDTFGTRTTERNDDEKAKVEEDRQRRPYHHRPCTCSPWRSTAPIKRTKKHLVVPLVVEMAAVVAVAEDNKDSRYG
jgi:hypothetical protein